MTDLQCLKIHFEVRYTHILNFSFVIKEILGPYLKLASSFSISNQGTAEESYKLDFSDDSFSIDFRWDRMIFLSERNIERFKEENSQIQIFFEVAEKLKSKDTFGVFTNYVYLVDMLKVIDNSFDKIKADIQTEFLTKNTDRIINNPDDLAIVLEKNGKNKNINITFGPFSESDINARNLIPFKSQELIELKNSSGILIELKIFEKTGIFNLALLKELISITNSYVKLI
jgi:hypothetical protein